MASGSPVGRHVRPAFLKSPTNFFFFVSTERIVNTNALQRRAPRPWPRRAAVTVT